MRCGGAPCGTSSFGALGVFFILMPLAAASQAGTDQPDLGRSAFRVHHDHLPLTRRAAHEQEPRLVRRVIRVWNRDGKRVSEGRAGLLERYPVLPVIRSCLPGIPRESHCHSGNLSRAQMLGIRRNACTLPQRPSRRYDHEGNGRGRNPCLPCQEQCDVRPGKGTSEGQR